VISPGWINACSRAARLKPGPPLRVDVSRLQGLWVAGLLG
jgi:hypothetical protein